MSALLGGDSPIEAVSDVEDGKETPWADASDLQALEDCAGKFDTVPMQVKRVCEVSLTGKTVFKAAWLQASKGIFAINSRTLSRT